MFDKETVIIALLVAILTILIAILLEIQDPRVS